MKIRSTEVIIGGNGNESNLSTKNPNTSVLVTTAANPAAAVRVIIAPAALAEPSFKEAIIFSSHPLIPFDSDCFGMYWLINAIAKTIPEVIAVVALVFIIAKQMNTTATGIKDTNKPGLGLSAS